jgi:hypothetical protein
MATNEHQERGFGLWVLGFGHSRAAASRQGAALLAGNGEVSGALPRRRYDHTPIPRLFFVFFAIFAVKCLCFSGSAQTNPPPVVCVRSFTNDVPNLPLVSVSLYGASNVTCLAYEEDLPAGVAVQTNSISGDGVWLPALNAVRWGPYTNTTSLSLSYRLAGWPGSYPVNGGSWMDGQWYFSPGQTLVTVLAPGGGYTPAPPPQAAMPVFTPASGANVPTNVTIACATPGAVIYYTLDGTLPTQGSTLYTGAVSLASASVIRAVAFTNGWTPSVAGFANYGPPAQVANAQVTRSVNTSSPTAPVVAFNVTPGTNAICVAVVETLPPGVGAVNVSAGGSYIASNNVVLWGPFIGSNVLSLSYTATGQPGNYLVQAYWSVDGVGGGEATGTNLVITSASGSIIPAQPPQVAMPVLSPANGANVPVSVTITDATPGAVIYYTLDGTLPTQSSTPYTGAVSLISPDVIRAAGFTNGWLPSIAAMANYGPPAPAANAQVTRSINTSSPTAPVVSFNVMPGTNALCVAVMEALPPGVGAANVSAGGNYIISNNAVLWGPFIGSNVLSLSYTATGQPGVYPVQAFWSVDGVGGGEAMGTNLVIAGNIIPTAPQLVPTPVLSPAVASSLPVTVGISCSDGLAQIYYTTDGTLPTQNSSRYMGPLNFNTQTTLRAVAFHTGYLPSVAAVGEYDPPLITLTTTLGQSVSGDGSFLPTVALNAAPPAPVICYAVVEPIPAGLTPSGLSGDGIWDQVAGVIRWGPYTDHQAREFSFNVSGASGSYPLAGQVSYNGYSAGATGTGLVQVNANYLGSPPDTNLAACATDYLTYNLEIDPAPGVITVTNASGTVNWGDGTQSAITNAVMTFAKSYGTAGTYDIAVTANWWGYANNTQAPMSGQATKTDSVQVVTTCLAPEIVTQPANQEVLAGSSAQFSVSASSTVPINYQWYFNQDFPIEGTVFSALTLPDVTPQSAGGYSVVITNAFGSITSSVASLTVVTPLISNIVNGTNGRVTLNFTGLPNTTTRLWATTNLTLPASWQPVYTNTTTTTNGTWQFIDTNAAGYPVRYYRSSTP